MKGRLFTRIRFDRKLHLDFAGTQYESCQIKDLNLTGMFVIGNFSQEVGEVCFIRLDQAGDSSQLSLEATAKVVRHTDQGIAIEFVSMSFDSYMFLQVTLLYEAGDPIAIGEELPETCPFSILEIDQAANNNIHPPQ